MDKFSMQDYTSYTNSDCETFYQYLQGDENYESAVNYSSLLSHGGAINNQQLQHNHPPPTSENYIMQDHPEILEEPVSTQEVPPPLTSPTTSPTSVMPCRDNYPGPLNFEILLDAGVTNRRCCVYSLKLNKVFIDIEKSLLLGIRVQPFLEGLNVRALPVFSNDNYVTTPVQRCDVHCLADDSLNKAHTKDPPKCFCHEFDWVRHVVRSNHTKAVYEYDCESERHSVRVPLEPPQPGTDTSIIPYHFSCKTSCSRGMNRQPIDVIFTLETEHREVIGRFLLAVKICSCPKRDKEREEMDTKTRKRNLSTNNRQNQDDVKKMKMNDSTPQKGGDSLQENESLAAIQELQAQVLELKKEVFRLNQEAAKQTEEMRKQTEEMRKLFNLVGGLVNLQQYNSN